MAELIPFAELRGGLRVEAAARADFAVLPVGAVEWHGPHLPFGTDVILASEFAARLRGDFTAVLFPAMPYSACPGKTSGHPGTIAIRPEIALAYLCDVLQGIVESGFERVLILNGHDANMSMARAAMEWVSGFRTASFLLVNWFQLLTPSETAHLFGETAGHNGRGHGGPYESAAVWSFAPESVNTDGITDLPPRPALATDRQHVLVESFPTPWDGWSGYISEASQAKGDELVDGALRQLEG
ncbi:MAG: creatininase family protein, partial [Chloroflexota bacterium]